MSTVTGDEVATVASGVFWRIYSVAEWQHFFLVAAVRFDNHEYTKKNERQGRGKGARIAEF